MKNELKQKIKQELFRSIFPAFIPLKKEYNFLIYQGDIFDTLQHKIVCNIRNGK